MDRDLPIECQRCPQATCLGCPVFHMAFAAVPVEAPDPLDAATPENILPPDGREFDEAFEGSRT